MRPPESLTVAALGFSEVDGIDALLRFFRAAVSLGESLSRVESTYPGANSDLRLVRKLSAGDVDALSAFLQRYAKLRKPLIGYLFLETGA